MVYFIGGKTGPVKIGTTVNLQARLKKLQTGSHSKLTILAVIEGGTDLETHYHERFSFCRLHGEWFSRSAALSEEIRRLKMAIWVPT